jgi:hypothetical protein
MARGEMMTIYNNTHNNMNNSISLLDTSAYSIFNEEESLDKSREHNKSKNKENEQNYKTELCRTWVEKNFCPYKEKCRFAHGKKDLHEKNIGGVKNYKQKECNSFFTKGYCPYGPRCHFKHDQRKMEEIDRIYYPFLLESPKTFKKLLRRDRIYQNSGLNTTNNNKSTLKIFDAVHHNNNQLPPQVMKQFISPTSAKTPINILSTTMKSMNRDFFIPRKIFDSHM